MVNVKPVVYTALCEVAKNVNKAYPTDWATFPIVQFTLEQNKENSTLLDGTESESYIRIRIDVWDKAPTFGICEDVTVKMKSFDYVRTDYMDVPDPSGLNHSIIRFETIKE